MALLAEGICITVEAVPLVLNGFERSVRDVSHALETGETCFVIRLLVVH